MIKNVAIKKVTTGGYAVTVTFEHSETTHLVDSKPFIAFSDDDISINAESKNILETETR